ncbi:Na+/H+ antiporter [Acidisoma sp.]|uniref:Na+/H+ antiporter n=1 Tax=Acidisoma sp. TaxID=1872115 RepID=UPI003AFFF0A5
MHLTTTILILLFVTAMTNLAVTVVRVPLPLLQIAVGALCDFAGFHVSFDPSLFLLLFIPPLLFADAYRIPKRELGEVGVPVIALAVGLVLFTTVGVGFFVHWLLPFVPLAAAFALAAVLSPTDAVALSGIMSGRSMPRRFMHILQGEALLNDASGLVSFNVAVSAVMVGSFSLSQAALSFVIVAAGGLAVGGAYGWGFFQLDRYVLARRSEEASIYILLILLLPFASYLTAQALDLSGILAAVATGVTLNLMDPFGGTHGAIRRRTFAIWSTLEFAFNGLIFLLLGLQLPAILAQGVRITVHAGHSPWDLLLLTGTVLLVLVVLRFIWVVLATTVRSGVSRARGRHVPIPGFLAICATSVAGVRGAVTLAGILSLPLLLPNGKGFPNRPLLISTAAGVIILSMLLAVLTLPWLIGRMPLPDANRVDDEIERARRQMAEGAIREIEARLPAALDRRQGAARAAYEEAARRVLADYRLKLQGRDDDDEHQEQAQEDQRAEIALRLRGVRAERAEMRSLRRRHAINDEAVQLLIEELDLEEETLSHIARTLPQKQVM